MFRARTPADSSAAAGKVGVQQFTLVLQRRVTRGDPIGQHQIVDMIEHAGVDLLPGDREKVDRRQLVERDGGLGGAQGIELGISAGANVMMPNFTPEKYRSAYDLYPGKSKTQVK